MIHAQRPGHAHSNKRDTRNGNAHLCRRGFCSLFARVASICSVISRYLQIVLFAYHSLSTRLSMARGLQEYDGPCTHTYLALHSAITNRNCTHTSPQTRQQHCAIYEGAERQSTKSPEVAWPGSQVDMQEFSGLSDGRQTCPAAYKLPSSPQQSYISRTRSHRTIPLIQYSIVDKVAVTKGGAILGATIQHTQST